MPREQILLLVGVIIFFCLSLFSARLLRSKQHSDLDAWTSDLVAFFKGASDPVKTKEMREFFSARDFTSLVGVIKRELRLDVRLRIGYVKSGGDANSPAWVELPQPMPPYGTESFRRATVTMFIRNEFIKQLPFETVVSAIAHEMSHIVLEATGHPLRKNEKVVDLTAMILGFSEIYVKGIAHERTFEVYDDAIQGENFVISNGSSRSTRTVKYKLGYLTVEEVLEASRLIARARKSTAKFAAI